MTYAVVAQRSNFMIFRREATAELAQKSVEALRLAGAGGIRVFDQTWNQLDSKALESVASDDAQRGKTLSTSADIRNIRIGGVSSRPRESIISDKPHGRVRVFKGKKL